jgi:thiamine-phosphate pyrophosphorylase
MLICVTNRVICNGDFLSRVRQLTQARPDALLLREKDLDEPSYEILARTVKAICDSHGVLLILHQNREVALKMQHSHLHLSLADLRTYQQSRYPSIIGASVHSVTEATEAQALGASYLVAGHIYPTACKIGRPSRGLSFLRQVCQAVTIPVFAIGGIVGDNVKDILESGAKGFCIMTAAMTCPDPGALVQEFQQRSSR